MYTKSKRIITTLSPFIREKLVQMSDKFECSQAEVVSKLSLKEGGIRMRESHALSDIRKGKSLTSAIKEQEINLLDTLKHLGKAIYKKNSHWISIKTSSIGICHWLHSNDKRISVVIKSPRDDSLKIILMILEFLLFMLKQ